MRRNSAYGTIRTDNNENPRQHEILHHFFILPAQAAQAVNIFANASGQCRSLWRGEETPSLSALLALISAQS